MTADQERAYYTQILNKVIDNPRFYLDNLERLDVFRVSFLNYTLKRRIKPKPYKGSVTHNEELVYNE